MNRSLRQALARSAVSDSPAAGIVEPIIRQGAQIEGATTKQSRDYVELSTRTIQASASTTPTGPAGGDLTGTYPSPTIGTKKVVITYIGSGVTAAGRAIIADGAGGATWGKVSSTGIDSGAAASGQTLVADGSGGVTWGAATSGQEFAFFIS